MHSAFQVYMLLALELYKLQGIDLSFSHYKITNKYTKQD